MRVRGEWFACVDGTVRPTVIVEVRSASGTPISERFLIDTGADDTVFTWALFERLGLPHELPVGVSYVGVGGEQPCVLVRTMLTFRGVDREYGNIHARFAAFASSIAASDLSVLSRDVLDQFHLLVSRSQNEILLLKGDHSYTVVKHP